MKLSTEKNTYINFFSNLIYAILNCAIGFISHSWWFLTVGAYYTILAVVRFYILRVIRTHNTNTSTQVFVTKFTGVLLVIMSFCLTGINILSALKDRGRSFHSIIMIAIATYTFAKISIAIVRMIKFRGINSVITRALLNISLADAVVSIYTLQMSMLTSFPGLTTDEIKLFNILTGTVVYLIVLFLGLNLIGGKYTNMAKSKIVKANKKIAETVTDGYKKIEKGVVGGYKKIEQGVVNGYTKIEDKFIDAYLTKDGETVEEAKARLKKEKK